MVLSTSSGPVSSTLLQPKCSGMIVVPEQGTRDHRENARTPCLEVPGGVPKRERAFDSVAGLCDGTGR
jgi:hypothetical protein